MVSSCWLFVFLTDVFEKALNAGFIQATDYVEIWQAYLDYLRRRVDFSKGESSCLWNRIYLCVWKLLISSPPWCVFFSAESSKELEELRGAFSRSLDYMKQDVEESRWIYDRLRFIFVLFSVGFSYNSLPCVIAGFGESGDPSCIIMQIWARIEVCYYDDHFQELNFCHIELWFLNCWPNERAHFKVRNSSCEQALYDEWNDLESLI